MKQNTKEWHQHRARGIGSSEVGILMGFNQWRSVKDLWEEKTGAKKPSFKMNPAMERGVRLEPCVRADVELRMDADFEPETFVHTNFDFMLASLDGWNAELRLALEIKCPNEKAHRQAVEGMVPEYYMPQCQHLLSVSGGDGLIYASFDGFKVVTVDVYPDIEYHGLMIERIIEFWNCVKSGEEPDEERFGRCE